MLMLAINGIPGLDIETIELERKGISYTYDTMKLLTEANPDTDYYFIIRDARHGRVPTKMAPY